MALLAVVFIAFWALDLQLLAATTLQLLNALAV